MTDAEPPPAAPNPASRFSENVRLRLWPEGLSARLLVLTVNRNNHAALHLYRRAGFHDSGELYHGGRSGPQHLLLRALP